MIDILGIPTNYIQRGEQGEHVLILHGWGTSAEKMMSVVNRLSKFFRVTAVDFPAHGESGLPGRSWGVPEFAEWTEAVIKTLHLAGCHVVAHSFGGRVALYLMAKKPNLISKVVLAGSAGLIKEKNGRDKIKSLWYRCRRNMFMALQTFPFARGWAEKKLHALRNRYNSKDYQALDERMRSVFQRVIAYDSRTFLPQIQHQVLILWGEQDQETPMWMAEVFHHDIKNSRLAILPGDHFAYMQYPDAFCDQVLDFFEEVSV